MQFLPKSANASKGSKHGANPQMPRVRIADFLDDPEALRRIGIEIFTGRSFASVEELETLWKQAVEESAGTSGNPQLARHTAFKNLIAADSADAQAIRAAFESVGVDVISKPGGGVDIAMRPDSYLFRSGKLSNYLLQSGFMEKTQRIRKWSARIAGRAGTAAKASAPGLAFGAYEVAEQYFLGDLNQKLLDTAMKASPTDEDITFMREHGWAWNAEEKDWETATWSWWVYWKTTQVRKTISALMNPAPPQPRPPGSA